MATKRRWARPKPGTMRVPVVAKEAVQDYLEGERDDWRWIKEAPRAALLEHVPEDFRFHTKPRLHQLAAFVLAQQLKRFLFYFGMGSGKTKLLLDLIRLRKFTGELRTALVCVPNLINFTTWEMQIEKHAPDLTYRVLQGSRAKRYKMLDEEPVDVCLINYGGLQTYMAASTRITRKGTNKRSMVVEDGEDFASLFNFLALDEIHLGVGSVRSLLYEMLKLISARVDYCYGASGMAHGADPEPLWPQFYVVDRGETLGASLGLFHAALYKPVEHRYTPQGFVWQFDKRKALRLHRMIQHRSLRYSDAEFSDLPQVVKYEIPVKLTPAQVSRYDELVEMAQIAMAAGETPEPVWIRQRQTAAGFIAIRGEDVEKLDVEFAPNPKAEALEAFLLELAEDEKLVVFHDYLFTGQIICRVLKRIGIDHAGVGGLWKDPGAQLRRFLKEPRCRVWVANCKAGGTGTDGLQEVCRWGLFFETPSNPVTRQQAIKRLHRDGQRRRVHIADLVASNVAIDRRVLRNCSLGIDTFKTVSEGKEQSA